MKEIKEIEGEVQPLLGEESSGPFPIPAQPTPHLLPDLELRLSKHHLMGTRGEEEGGKTSLAVSRQPPLPQLSTFPRQEQNSQVLPGASHTWLASLGRHIQPRLMKSSAARLPPGHGLVSHPSGQTFAPKRLPTFPWIPPLPLPLPQGQARSAQSPPRTAGTSPALGRAPRQPSAPGRARGTRGGSRGPGGARGEGGRRSRQRRGETREGRGGPREARGLRDR